MGAKRKIPSLAEITKGAPASVLDAIFDLLRSSYAPLLTKESPERVEAFLKSRRDHLQEMVLLTSGYDFVVQSPASAFLRMLDESAAQRPTTPLTRPAQFWPDGDAILNLLWERRQNRDGAFIRDFATLVEDGPKESGFDKFTAEVSSALQDGRKLYRKGEGKANRGRSYLQILLLAVVEGLIHKLQRLPTVQQVRYGVNTIMDNPPGKREFDDALVAIGMAPPVLV